MSEFQEKHEVNLSAPNMFAWLIHGEFKHFQYGRCRISVHS